MTQLIPSSRKNGQVSSAPLFNLAALSSPAFNVQRYDLTEVNRFLCDRLMLCAVLLSLLPSLASFSDSRSLNACMFPQSIPGLNTMLLIT